MNLSGPSKGMTVGSLVAGGYVSIIRNRLIADMFNDAGLI